MNMICINCPKGCHLSIEKEGDGWNIQGYACERGKTYALSEMTDPRRTLTSTVKIKDGTITRCPVKTSSPIPKDMVRDAAKSLDSVTVTAPVKVGDVIVANVLDTGSDIIATRNIAKA